MFLLKQKTISCQQKKQYWVIRIKAQVLIVRVWSQNLSLGFGWKIIRSRKINFEDEQRIWKEIKIDSRL